jgi:hypothetical protein
MAQRYWRLNADEDKQGLETALKQVHTREIWGEAAPLGGSGTGFACARAWFGNMPADADGVEFETDVPPSSCNPRPGGEVHWKLHTDFPQVQSREDGRFAAIRVKLTRVRYKKESSLKQGVDWTPDE